jgi:BirA family transcriptional regulator, biotin operon repressor / biotin---[acetyl-CoA-carboxylase] ligase
METDEFQSWRSALEPKALKRRLGASIFAANMVFRESVDSTNTLAKHLARDGAPEGTLVLAESQSGGKGRLDRNWLSPGFCNLYLSLIMRPSMAPGEVFVLTMILALSAVKGVEAVTGLGPGIKWPNDLYLAHRKFGGILTEFSVSGGTVEYVVLGLGLNVNWNPEDDQVSYACTSLMTEAGEGISRDRLLVEILSRFERYYGEVLSGKVDGFYEQWNRRSLLMGRHVEVQAGDGVFSGRVLRIDRGGALIIKDENDREQRVLSGDVSVRHWDGGEGR